MALTLEDHGFGYCGDCVLSEWTAVVVPTDYSRNDSRFRPLIGHGHHISRDHAVKVAVSNLKQQIDDLEREIAVLGLAGEPDQ
jgi:hypothetical protein